MPESVPHAPAGAQAREAAMFAALLASARQLQAEAQAKSPATPRFVLESARAMAAHLGMPEARMQEFLVPMALWQFHLQAAIGARTWDFAAVRECMPWSVQRLGAALQPMQSRAQVAHAAFHMAGFPLVCALVGTVVRDAY
ncbi:MAG: hypothetical protein EOO24_64325, partial [Comamonadaceae bacterium]